MKKLYTLSFFFLIVIITSNAQTDCNPATITNVEQQGTGNHITWTIPLTGEEVTISQSGDFKGRYGDEKFSFGAYHRFTPEDLSAINGAVFTQVVFAPTYSLSQTEPSHSYILQIYQGGVWGIFGERNPVHWSFLRN
jgi:hypothetical protein